MQQVGSKAILANARPVDPRSLPVVQRRPKRRLRIGLEHFWVLQRRLVLRGAAIFAVLTLAIVAWQAREPIGAGLTAAGDLVQGEFADAGFAVGEISISGQMLTRESEILAALGIAPRTSTLDFDAEAARARIAELPAIETVTIRKVYPGDVIVNVTEKVPVARWRVDGITFLVDAHGQQIGEDHGAWGDLPLVIGDGAADDAMAMIRSLEQFPDLSADIVALSRIADRRWDLIYDTGLRVQLPEFGVAQALRDLEAYQRDYALLDRDVTIIDLRIPELVALRPAQREEEDDQE